MHMHMHMLPLSHTRHARSWRHTVAPITELAQRTTRQPSPYLPVQSWRGSQDREGASARSRHVSAAPQMVFKDSAWKTTDICLSWQPDGMADLLEQHAAQPKPETKFWRLAAERGRELTSSTRGSRPSPHACRQRSARRCCWPGMLRA